MSQDSTRRASRWPRSAACCFVLAGYLVSAHAEYRSLAELPLEELISLEVSSASKFPQKLSEAPSAVSVVTAADIKAYGWRTLADVLRSMRGLYVTSDRNYSYLGARGFLRPGDYNTRFLLLVDGYRTNDAVYDQAAIGHDFVIDVDLIERVEFVPGPGSSIYGSNAFFGVINVITKSARDLPGVRASVEAASGGGRAASVTAGWHAGDTQVLVGASAVDNPGRDLYFPEFDQPETNGGVARGLDFERAQKLFVKASSGPFSLALAHAERTKGIPTASFSQLFNDPRSRTVDIQDFIDAGYRTALSEATTLHARGYWGNYDYSGDYVYQRLRPTVNRDGAHARWWGGELRVVTTRFAQHKLVAGVEYRNDYRRDQFNYDLPTGPQFSIRTPSLIAPQSSLFDQRAGARAGLFLQDEITLRPDWLLNAGVRYDHDRTSGGIVNPRLGLIWQATARTTLKALYGSAFRSPNAYEAFYQLNGPGGQKPNPTLRPERIRSRELVLEHAFSSDSRLTATVFQNTVTDLISQTADADGLLEFRNIDRAKAEGIGIEFERNWHSGLRLRTNASFQRAHDANTGMELVNSPRQLAKLNVSLPLAGTAWRTGTELQYVGRRHSLQGEVGGYWLANLTLSSLRLGERLEVTASVYNLFDRRYADPGSEEHAQDAIAQDGRTLRVKLSYAF